jgi:hypothetical protein
MYAYPGLEINQLQLIIDEGFKRIDAAVEAVIAKYPDWEVPVRAVELEAVQPESQFLEWMNEDRFNRYLGQHNVIWAGGGCVFDNHSRRGGHYNTPAQSMAGQSGALASLL